MKVDGEVVHLELGGLDSATHSACALFLRSRYPGPVSEDALAIDRRLNVNQAAAVLGALEVALAVAAIWIDARRAKKALKSERESQAVQAAVMKELLALRPAAAHETVITVLDQMDADSLHLELHPDYIVRIEVRHGQYWISGRPRREEAETESANDDAANTRPDDPT